MANRRMFAKTVVNSSKFLRMPPSSRLLYYDLGMAADDDGIVEAFTVIKMTGAAEDDLRVLHAKGFVIVLNEDLVTYITDWSQNNQIKRDRYSQSVYHELLVKITDGTKTEPELSQNGTQMEPQVRLGKDSVVKDSIGKYRLGNSSNSKSASNNTPLPPKGEQEPNLEELFGYNEFLLEAVKDWLKYKQEKRQAYHPAGLKNLMTIIRNKVARYGEDAVIEVIRESMGANYQGITWDKLKQNSRQGRKPLSFADL